jgi:hypothetical protein
LLRSSVEAGVLTKATQKCDALQKGVLSVRNDNVAVVQILTVTNNLQSYTVSERNRMKQAMELAEKLGYPSAGTMMEFINSGTMNNLPVTAHDAARAYAAYGTPISLIQGKTVHTAEKSTTPEQLPRTISSVVELHYDIMFVEGIPFLISVGKPLDLCMVTILGSGVGACNSQAMRTAMTSHYNAYWSRHFKINVVVMDGESSAAKAALETNEVEFAPLPAGVHDSIVESRIRRLKEWVRSIIQGLPFPTSRPLLAWIVMYVVYITNLLPKRHGFRGGPYVQGRTSSVSDPTSGGIYRTHLVNTYRLHRARWTIA